MNCWELQTGNIFHEPSCFVVLARICITKCLLSPPRFPPQIKGGTFIAHALGSSQIMVTTQQVKAVTDEID
jgi:hypothetical protein